MGTESEPQTAELASFINMQAPRPQPRMRGFQESPEHPSHGPAAAELVAAAQPLGKGPAFPMTGRPLNSADPPSYYLPLWKAAPHPLHQPVAPERTQASLCEPGSQGGHWASPGGLALEMGNWLQNSPSPPPTGPEHSPPFSAPLPHCLIVTEALHQPAVPLPCSSGQGTGDSVHPRSDPSLPPLQPAPLARSGLSSVGAALRPRRAGCQPGQRAALQPSGQVPACLSLLDASSNRELPLSRSSPLRARTRRGFAEPSPAFCICLRGSRSPLTPSALRSLQAASSLRVRSFRAVEQAPHQGSALGSPSRSQSQPSTPVPPVAAPLPLQFGSWDGALCPAVLQGAQGRARVSPPVSSCAGSPC